MARFRVWIEINLILASRGMKNSLVFRVGIEIDLTSAFGSKSTWFRVGDRN